MFTTSISSLHSSSPACSPYKFKSVCYLSILILLVLSLGACKPKHATHDLPSVHPEIQIEFYDSQDIAEAHAAISQYKGALAGGNFVAAYECLQKFDISKAIPPQQACNLYVFVPCNDCSNGACQSCHGTGACTNCLEGGICATCKGECTRTLKCNACICSHCGGNGTCPSCQGFLKKQCPACLGAGFGNEVITSTCTKCDGKGRINFQMSTGSHSCPICRGKGKIEKGHVPCSTCRGNGQIICRECQGRGRCSACAGIGRKNCSTCGGRGSFVQTCPKCNGSGKCLVCKGTHLCTTCQGGKLVSLVADIRLFSNTP